MISSPLLLDFPLPILTSRLMIRPMMPGDGRSIWQAIEESKESLNKWLPWSLEVKDWQDCKKTARIFYANFILRKDFNFCIFKDGQFVGGCALRTPDWSIPSVSMSYWCRSKDQGQGYITEATGALTLFAFQELGFKRVTILCDAANSKSIAVAERLGFSLETVAKGLIDNAYGEELCMAHRYVRFDSSGLENSYAYPEH
mgnify:CR=1 FL=1